MKGTDKRRKLTEEIKRLGEYIPADMIESNINEMKLKLIKRKENQ